MPGSLSGGGGGAGGGEHISIVFGEAPIYRYMYTLFYFPEHDPCLHVSIMLQPHLIEANAV